MRFELIKSFGGTEGALPFAGVIQDSTGALFGTTELGGASGYGTAYKLTPDGAGGFSHTVIKNFNYTDGAHPRSVVTLDNDTGVLYGTTAYGGGSDYGTVYKLTPDGAGGYSHSVLKSFFDGPDGAHPFVAGVIQDCNGVLYGTTGRGGAHGYGTVYKLTPDGDGEYTHSVIFSFSFAIGAYPEAGVIVDGTGALYGTTTYGGPSFYGTVYKLSPNGAGNYVHSLLNGFFNGADGRNLYAGVIRDSTGALYGTTADGNQSDGSGGGTVYKLTPDGLGGYTHRVLKSFNVIDGFDSRAALIQDNAGALYGTTRQGGSSGVGTVFKLTPDGAGGYTHSMLKEFATADGAFPHGALYNGPDGTLYGTTSEGGEFSFGIVFCLKFDSDGDGVPNSTDACPNSAAVGESIVIAGCNTGVPNRSVSGGCTIGGGKARSARSDAQWFDFSANQMPPCHVQLPGSSVR